MASQARLRPFRTTAFKLSAIYLAVFTLFTAFLIGYIARNTSEILQIQMRQALDGELNVMASQYQRGGIRRIAQMVQLRSRQPGANIYLVTDARGGKVAGNVESVPPAVLTGSDSTAQIVSYVRLGEEPSGQRGAALVRVVQLADGFRILVGRDVSEIEDLTQLVRRSLVLTAGLMVALGLVSWAFVSRRVLKRIDSIAETSRGIIAGDLSGRLEVTGTDDEFDRLAHSLNAMLARIERLMLGLKQVSDNIAHDLKTPLTRMRTRAEAALAPGRDPGEIREALQATIDDSDQLIRTFNALLMIARAEAGSSDVRSGSSMRRR
jgi:methyl-accepting chemotaxis protein